MVRPRMLLLKSGQTRSLASDGLIQLLVGPASSACSEQMKVRCSVRATSCGCERWRKEFGRRSWLRRISVPSVSMWSIKRSFSASLPSHHTTRSGRVVRATSSTHSSTDDIIGILLGCESHFSICCSRSGLAQVGPPIAPVDNIGCAPPPRSTGRRVTP